MNDVARLIQTESSSNAGVTQQIHDVNTEGTKRKVYYNIHQAHLTPTQLEDIKILKTVMTNYLLSSITQIGVLTYLTGNVVWLVA